MDLYFPEPTSTDGVSITFPSWTYFRRMSTSSPVSVLSLVMNCVIIVKGLVVSTGKLDPAPKKSLSPRRNVFKSQPALSQKPAAPQSCSFSQRSGPLMEHG